MCNFNKKKLLDLKRQIGEISNLLIDPDYSEIASIVIDGELKAASDEYMVFVYKTKRMELEFNEHLIKIDEMMNKVFSNHYKAIATDEENWQLIKKEFNNKLKEYTLLQEPSNLVEYLGNKNENNTLIDNMFGEIVEYN